MMFRTCVAAAAAIILTVAAPAFARPFTATDLAMLDRVSSPKVSADGRYVAYVVRSTDWDGNRGVSALNLIDLRGDVSKPLALLSGEKGAPSPSWSADGRWLYFLSSKSGSSQVWRSTPDGSVRQQLTAFPIDVGGFAMAWTMDSTAFIDVQFGSVADIRDWERFSPAAFANRWKVPMLVIHGGRDYRVPTDQGIAAHNAARRAGIPTELLIFPDENHWVLKPQNSVQWYRTVEDWMDRWTGGEGARPQAVTAATR